MAYTNSSNFAKKFCGKSPFKKEGDKSKSIQEALIGGAGDAAGANKKSGGEHFNAAMNSAIETVTE